MCGSNHSDWIFHWMYHWIYWLLYRQEVSGGGLTGWAAIAILVKSENENDN